MSSDLPLLTLSSIVTLTALHILMACEYVIIHHHRVATSSTPAFISVFYSGSITYLEHIVVNVTLLPTGITDPRRGHISVEIRSPSRTLSTLLKFRSIDDTNRDYIRWPFMSVAFWGENPRGTWQLTIRSQSRDTNADYSNLRFQFYGTSVTPPAVARIPNRCHSDCARGCAAPGAEFCDVCANLRDAYTMECIDQCPPGYTQRNGYCYNGSLPEPVCNSKVPSLTSGTTYTMKLKTFKEENVAICDFSRKYLGMNCLSSHSPIYVQGFSQFHWVTPNQQHFAENFPQIFSSSLYTYSSSASVEQRAHTKLCVCCCTGSCVEAGYDGCCSEGKCEGTISSSPFGLCHCDKICHNINDCCRDIEEVNCTRQGIYTSVGHKVTVPRSYSCLDYLSLHFLQGL